MSVLAAFVVLISIYAAVKAVIDGASNGLPFLTWKNFWILLVGGGIGLAIAVPFSAISNEAGYVALAVAIVFAYVSVYTKLWQRLWNWLWHLIPASVRSIIITVLKIAGVVIAAIVAVILIVAFLKLFGL